MTAPPPHNLDAERALLGAMLGNVDARKAGLDGVEGAQDFYDPWHAQVFAAIEAMYERGDAVDPRTVATWLERTGAATSLVRGKDPAALLRTLAAHVPASLSARTYAATVAELAVLRRAIGAGLDLAEIGRDDSPNALERVETFVADLPRRLAAPVAVTAPPTEASLIAAREYPYRWVVPNLLERLDVGVIVGLEGGGKSLALRQWSVQLASGVHPFSLASIEARRVLIVDCENTEAQVARSLQWLLDVAGERYTGSLWIENRPAGIDLSGRADGRWLEAKIETVKPDVLVIGPLYKMYRGATGRSKHSEESAEIVTATLDELKVRYDLAVLIEAHAPWAQGTSGREFRIRGSAAWTGWAGFSIGLAPVKHAERREVRLVRPVRGDRDAGREWPRRLAQGAEWPWEDPDRGAPPPPQAALLGDEPF